MHRLAEGDFVEHGVNVLAFGLPGTGKTHAMCAIGQRLVESGRSVLFAPAYRLVQDMLAAKRDLELPRMLRKLDNFDLLVIDDLEYLPQGAEESEVLFTLIAERYERRSLGITSNLVFSEWEKAFPATVTRTQFDQVNRIMRSRAPKVSHPRRVGSTFLLSGLVKCYRCKRALSGRYSSRGTFPYYVCHSFVKRAPGSSDSPRVDARQFEELVVGLIRSNVLTEGNIRGLIDVVDEQMDDVAGDERKRLETIESELADVRSRLDRLYDLVETTTEFNMAHFADRIQDHKERKERLESAAEGARAVLAQRRAVLDDVNTITAYAEDMSRFLQKSDMPERRAFIETFVKEIELLPDNAVVRYSVPLPDDSLIPGKKVQEIPLNGSVVSSVNGSPPPGTDLRTPPFRAISAESAPPERSAPGCNRISVHLVRKLFGVPPRTGCLTPDYIVTGPNRTRSETYISIDVYD